ncbi:MAG: DMT family transporter [Candidatus Nanopelagicales bacterium]
MPTDPRVRRGLVLAFLGVLAFSFTLPMTKIALQGFDAVVIAFGRAAIAGVVAAVVLLALRVRPPSRSMLRPLLLSALGVVVGFPLLTTLALRSTTSAHAAVVIAGLPIATAVFAVLRAGERVSRSFWWASTTGTAAVIVFALTRGGATGAGLVPDLLLLGAVAAAAFGYVEGALLSRAMPGWQVVSWMLVVSLPVTVPVTVALQWRSAPDHSIDASALLALLYLALFSMYVGFFWWYAGLAAAGVARAGQMQLLQPLLTLLWSVLLLGETVGWPTLLAAAVVLVCVGWTQRARPAPAVPRTAT